MSKKSEKCGHTRESTLAALQQAAAAHGACAACSATAGLYLASLAAYLDMGTDRADFLETAGDVWDDMLRQGVLLRSPDSEPAVAPPSDVN